MYVYLLKPTFVTGIELHYIHAQFSYQLIHLSSDIFTIDTIGTFVSIEKLILSSIVSNELQRLHPHVMYVDNSHFYYLLAAFA